MNSQSLSFVSLLPSPPPPARAQQPRVQRRPQPPLQHTADRGCRCRGRWASQRGSSGVERRAEHRCGVRPLLVLGFSPLVLFSDFWPVFINSQFITFVDCMDAEVRDQWGICYLGKIFNVESLALKQNYQPGPLFLFGILGILCSMSNLFVLLWFLRICVEFPSFCPFFQASLF